MEDLPAYSTLEVAKHVTPEDAWLIVGGKVLNVSSWLDEHPGGDVVLLDLAGTLNYSSFMSLNVIRCFFTELTNWA